MNKLKALTTSWQAVALIGIGAAVFVASWWAPPDVRGWILGPTGLLGTVLGLLHTLPSSQDPPPPPPPTTPGA